MSNGDVPERFSLKDHLFNRETVSYLADLFSASEPGFDSSRFVDEVMAGMTPLALKARISFIAEVLLGYLPADFEDIARVIEGALPPPLDPELSDDDFGEFILAPLGEIVANKGLDAGDYDTSLSLLKEITKRFSMEGPIRPFIDQYPERTLALLDEWAGDKNYHVRRLVSEGTRPLLPWAPRIGLEVGATIPLLDKLHDDPTRYVTRSVANHMNDIAKLRPELAIETLHSWREIGLQKPSELAWMTRHALRMLVKKGHPQAMQFLGYSPDPKVGVELAATAPTGGRVLIGESLHFEVVITSYEEQMLVVDYVIEFIKNDGSTRSKVFKLRNVEMSNGETRVLSKKHRFLANASTFTVHPGRHRLTMQINGKPFSEIEFDLHD